MYVCICKAEYEEAYDNIVKGSILRSHVRWYEEGEKNTRYFLSLENQHKKKSCVRKIFDVNYKLTSNPKEMMRGLETFYKNLYSENRNQVTIEVENKFLSNKDMPKLNDQDRNICESQLTIGEGFRALESFENNKSPGNYGLTAEFGVSGPC